MSDNAPVAPERPVHVTITVCTTCRPEGVARDQAPGRTFFDALRDALGADPLVTVRPSECLSVCKRPLTIAVSDTEGYTFVFGDLVPETAIPALKAFAAAYVDKPAGFVPWKERPEVLRKAIVARIPPVGWSPEDGSAP